MLNWEDYYFIVGIKEGCTNISHMATPLYRAYIIVDKYGTMVRPVFFRSEKHALRSVKRLMQKLEIEAENTLLGKEST